MGAEAEREEIIFVLIYPREGRQGKMEDEEKQKKEREEQEEEGIRSKAERKVLSYWREMKVEGEDEGYSPKEE